MHPAFIPAGQVGIGLTYRRGMEGWVDLGVGHIPRWFTCPPSVPTVTYSSNNHLIASRQEVKPSSSRPQVWHLTITRLSHLVQVQVWSYNVPATINWNKCTWWQCIICIHALTMVIKIRKLKGVYSSSLNPSQCYGAGATGNGYKITMLPATPRHRWMLPASSLTPTMQAGTQFRSTNSKGMEGWVKLKWFICPQTFTHHSPIQKITTR